MLSENVGSGEVLVTRTEFVIVVTESGLFPLRTRVKLTLALAFRAERVVALTVPAPPTAGWVTTQPGGAVKDWNVVPRGMTSLKARLFRKALSPLPARAVMV